MGCGDIFCGGLDSFVNLFNLFKFFEFWVDVWVWVVGWLGWMIGVVMLVVENKFINLFNGFVFLVVFVIVWEEMFKFVFGVGMEDLLLVGVGLLLKLSRFLVWLFVMIVWRVFLCEILFLVLFSIG